MSMVALATGWADCLSQQEVPTVLACSDDIPEELDLPYCTNEYIKVVQTLLARVVESSSATDRRFMAAVYEHVTAHMEEQAPTTADLLASGDDFFVSLLLEGYRLHGDDPVYDDKLVWEELRVAACRRLMYDRSSVVLLQEDVTGGWTSIAVSEEEDTVNREKKESMTTTEKKALSHLFEGAETVDIPLPKMPAGVDIVAPPLAHACVVTSLLVKFPDMDRADAAELHNYMLGPDGEWLLQYIRTQAGVSEQTKLTTIASFLSPNLGSPSTGLADQQRAPYGPYQPVYFTAFKVGSKDIVKSRRVRNAMVKMLHIVRGEILPAAPFHFRTLGVGGDDMIDLSLVGAHSGRGLAFPEAWAVLIASAVASRHESLESRGTFVTTSSSGISWHVLLSWTRDFDRYAAVHMARLLRTCRLAPAQLSFANRVSPARLDARSNCP